MLKIPAFGNTRTVSGQCKTPNNKQNDRMNLSYLHTPSQIIVDPPIDTTIQELPLEKLSWEDFEKLCLVIVF